MTIDELKQRLPLPELLARLGFTFQKNGMCKCMFHDDSTPSFGIYNKDKWRFKCFSGGCRASRGGDELDFVALHFVCSRADALRKYEDMTR